MNKYDKKKLNIESGVDNGFWSCSGHGCYETSSTPIMPEHFRNFGDVFHCSGSGMQGIWHPRIVEDHSKYEIRKQR
jgi:hypothetical protein